MIRRTAAMLSADVRKSKVNILKNKLKIVLLGAMCALFLQAPLSVSAVDLPFVPADESETVTTTVADNDTPMISETQATTVKPEPQATTISRNDTSVKTTTAKTTAAEDTANQNKLTETSRTAKVESNDLPVIAPDGEEVEIEENTGSEPSEDTSTQSTASAENSTISSSESKTETEKSNNSSLPIIIAVICGAAVIAIVAAFTLRKKGK